MTITGAACGGVHPARVLILTRLWGQNPVSGPGPCAFGVVDPGSIPAILTFGGADSSLASGSPFHRSSERRSVFGGPGSGRGFALAGDHDGTDAQVGQRVVDALLTVAAVGGDGTGHTPGALDDAFHHAGAVQTVSGAERAAVRPRP